MNATVDPIHHLSQRIKYLPRELNATINEIEKQQTIAKHSASMAPAGSAEKTSLLTQVWVYEALKSMALVRHDKYEQVMRGHQILEKIVCNDRLIAQRDICTYLQEALFATRDLDGVCNMWERHVMLTEKNKKRGSSKCVEENVVLFHVYARCRQLQKLYQQAMKIYKMTNKTEHLHWALVSMAEQARSLPQEQSAQRNMVLTIASRMLDKHLKEERQSSELILYFSQVFIENERWDDAKRLLLDTANIVKLEQFDKYPDGRATQLAIYLQRSGSIRESNAVYQMLLAEHEADEWQWWLSYLDTVQQEKKDDGNDSTAAATASVQWTEDTMRQLDYSGHDPIQFIHAMQTKNGEVRGPYLAELELHWRQNGAVDAKLLNAYFARFGHKLVCFADLLKYLPAQSDAEAVDALLKQLHNTVVNDTSSSSRAPSNQFCFEINYHKFHHVLVVESAEQNMQTIRSLFAKYTEAKKLNTGLATDFQTTDPLLQLIVHKCLRTVDPDQVPSNNLLVEIAALLEDGIKLSPSNFQLRFLAIRVYIMLGAVQSAIAHYRRLDVKNVQFESVAYIVYYDLQRFGQWQSLKSLAQGAIELEQEHEENTGNMVFQSMSLGNFTSVAEFLKFGDMLDRSFTSKQSHTDNLCFSLMDNMTPYVQRFSLFSNNRSYLRLKQLNQRSDWEEWLMFNEDLDMVDTLGHGDNILERFILPSAVQDNKRRIKEMRQRMKAILAIGALTEMSFLIMEEARLTKLRKQNEKEEKRRQKKQQKKGAGSQQQQASTSKSVKDELEFMAKTIKLREQLQQCNVVVVDGDELTEEWQITEHAIVDVIPSIFDFCESDTMDVVPMLNAMNKWNTSVAEFLPKIEYLSTERGTVERMNLSDIINFSKLLFSHLLWWTCIVQTAVFVLRTKRPSAKPKGVTDPIDQFKSQLSSQLSAAVAWLAEVKKAADTTHFADVVDKNARLIPDADFNEDDVLKGIKHGISGTIEQLRTSANNLLLEVNALSSAW